MSASPPTRRLPRPLAALSLLATAALLALLFGHWLAPDPLMIDRSIIQGLRAWGGPSWLPGVAVDLTALGGSTVVTLVVVLVAGFLLMQRLWLTALALVLATSTGGQMVWLIKRTIGRARPDLVPHLVDVSNASFPSGHATNSAIIYLTMAGLVAQVARERAVRRYVLGLAVVLVGAIGMSRVYLGVHWPSDVLAGWSAGTGWAALWWWIAATVRARLADRSSLRA